MQEEDMAQEQDTHREQTTGKRQNISTGNYHVTFRISPDEKARLDRLMKRHKFHTKTAISRSALLLMMRLLEKADERAESLSIDDMEDTFTAFTEWELPDYARNNSHRGDYLASLLLDKEPTQDTPPTTEDDPNQPARLGNSTCKVSDLACKVSAPTTANLASSARFFDRYISRNYERIYGLSRGANSGSKGGRSHTDILHDTLLSMRDEAARFSSYEAFEEWANAKFTPKHRRQNPQITGKRSEPTEREFSKSRTGDTPLDE